MRSNCDWNTFDCLPAVAMTGGEGPSYLPYRTADRAYQYTPP
jgi:hypothetical protein